MRTIFFFCLMTSTLSAIADTTAFRCNEAAIPVDATWWKYAVFYHIYPKSFQDFDSDGIGDIRGIISRLDYLTVLGIDAIWLSPVYRSPMADGGYDISDYRDIDPLFGSMCDFKELLEQAHDRGIRVMMDLVMNHTSDQHPWFVESRSSLDNPKRDWYIWHAGHKAPNNWRTNFLERAWQYDPITRQYYYHSFFKEQPDLNWRNESMKRAFFENIRFWLDMGIDGFRLDVVNMIVKDSLLRSNSLLNRRKVYNRNQPETYDILRKFRLLLDEYPGTASVGEIYVLPPGDSKLVTNFLGNGNDMLHMGFDFSLLFCTWNARKYCHAIQSYYEALPPDGWPCFTFSNHDMGRSLNRFGRRRHVEEKARLLAVMLMTLKGTPFIYYGDEIGMTNVHIPRKQIHDKYGKMFWPIYQGRDSGRTPMQWDAGSGGGFTAGKPWLPLNKDYQQVNVESETADENSVLNIYCQLITLRKEVPVLKYGKIRFIKTGRKGVISYVRSTDAQQIQVVLNFTSRKREFIDILVKDSQLIFSTHHRNITDNEKIILQPFEASMWLIMK